MSHKIKKVIPKENLMLEVEFENKIKKLYDVKQILKKWEQFKILEEEKQFKKVIVDVGGYGISWNETVDLSCEEIWENGKIIRE